ncbi:MAG: heme ABC exporter ATP-binding protein CcmA [Magnetospiraceae bacterium]
MSDAEAKQGLYSGMELTCVRGDRLVFENLSFSLAFGGALVLIGPNGSGKSSLLRILAGLLTPFSGEILWNDTPVREDPEAQRARLHYVGHHDAVKPVLSVRENIAFWAGLREAGDSPLLSTALQAFRIDHLADVPGRFLSAGQKRRVNLARICAAQAKIWLLDEPTTALDKQAIADLEAVIQAHRQSGGMVILSTHSDIALGDHATLNLADYAVDEDPASALELHL